MLPFTDAESCRRTRTVSLWLASARVRPYTCRWGLARCPGGAHTRQPTIGHPGEDRQNPLRSRGHSRHIPGVSELIHVGPDRTHRHPCATSCRGERGPSFGPESAQLAGRLTNGHPGKGLRRLAVHHHLTTRPLRSSRTLPFYEATPTSNPSPCGKPVDNSRL